VTEAWRIEVEFLLKVTFSHYVGYHSCMSNTTEITYTTSTNITNDPVVESIVYTHIANILYALLMLETGYVNGLMERQR
jgi:hypothetical protein